MRDSITGWKASSSLSSDSFQHPAHPDPAHSRVASDVGLSGACAIKKQLFILSPEGNVVDLLSHWTRLVGRRPWEEGSQPIDIFRRQSEVFSQFRDVYDQFRFSSLHPADDNRKPETQIRSSHIGEPRGAELHEESNLRDGGYPTPRSFLPLPISS